MYLLESFCLEYDSLYNLVYLPFRLGRNINTLLNNRLCVAISMDLIFLPRSDLKLYDEQGLFDLRHGEIRQPTLLDLRSNRQQLLPCIKNGGKI